MNIVERTKTIFDSNGYTIDPGMETDQLQLDSIQFISIMCDIENEFSIMIPEDYLIGEALNCFEDFVYMINSLM